MHFDFNLRIIADLRRLLLASDTLFSFVRFVDRLVGLAREHTCVIDQSVIHVRKTMSVFRDII